MRELPELPHTDERIGICVGDDQTPTLRFTAAEMQAFARQAVAAAMERAAKIAEAQVDIYNQKMAQARSADRQEAWERAYNHHDAANYIAAAIRAEIEKDPK